jgi:alkanesulfonate monooxygenase SsuD/methylene tetrahydromethanopterin reductase-like flavin-dependent oxidoreductase (luciferase family)
MIGGGGEKLLRVAAAEADIVNIIPPSSGAKGKVALDEALAFGLSEFRHKVDTLAQACREIGRDFGDIELSGMVFVLIGRTEEEAIRPHDGADDGPRRHRAHGRLRAR